MVQIADQHNSNIPALPNQVAEDIPDIKENLEFHKDSFERLFKVWSVTDNSASKLNPVVGFTDGTYNYEFPTNGISASSVIMLGNASTIAWFYLNAAPPGWKVTTTGKGTALSVSDTTGTSNGTTTSTSSNNLVDSGADFVSDGVAVGDVVYNTTDSTVTTVAAVTDLNTLALDDDYFTTSEGYIVGKAYVEAGGRQAANGSWTQPNHTLTSTEMPTHSHTVGRGTTVGAGAYATGAITFAANSITSGNAGSGGAHNHGSVYRPSASIGKLFQLDTA